MRIFKPKTLPSLERQFNKTMNEHDIRMIIRRSIAREPPRKEPKLTNA